MSEWETAPDWEAAPDKKKEPEKTFLGEVRKGAEREIPHGGLIGAAVGGAAAAAGYGMEKLQETVGKGYKGIAEVAGASPQTSETIGKVASLAPDIAMGGGVGKQAGKGAVESIAQHFMESAIHPRASGMNVKMAESIAKTALDKGLSVTKAGVEKLGNMVETLDAQAKNIIAYSKSVIPAKDILSQLKTPQAKAVFNKMYRSVKGGDIPIQQAQEFKQELGRRISQYQRMPIQMAGKSELTEGRMEVERVLRNTIAQSEPNISSVNQQMHELLTLLPYLERKVVQEMGRLVRKPAALESTAARAIKATGERTGQAVGAASGAVAGQLGQRPLGEP